MRLKQLGLDIADALQQLQQGRFQPPRRQQQLPAFTPSPVVARADDEDREILLVDQNQAEKMIRLSRVRPAGEERRYPDPRRVRHKASHSYFQKLQL